ncbi:MAG TPA: nuclear transport factor 2 family protein [Acetobacteraceae bacterium]|nr:nuclear transport factor 2 family protein [Acetobacteraceae bacterium]
MTRGLAILLLLAALAAPAAAQGPVDPPALLRAWAEAYATNDGPRAAALYTEDARLWGSVSREQTVGHAAIARYFGRARPGAAQIAVRFGEHGLRLLSADVAVASGHYTFLRRNAEGVESEEPSRFSMTMLRGADGAWRIADHHSSRLPRER